MFFKRKTGAVEFMIVGLGNPGVQYQNTRHNAGFMALDATAKALDIRVERARFLAYCGEGVCAGRHVLLMKPQTYMNNSGEAVCEAMRFYKLSPEQVLLLFDDVSLPVGGMRVRRSGSAGGQNGVKSILQLSGSDMFPRVKLADGVLSRFSEKELSVMGETAEKAAAAAELIVSGNIEEAMNRYSH